MKSNLLILSFWLAAGMAATATPKQTEAFTLLKNLRAKASVAATHATDLVATADSMSWQTNAFRLDALKNDVNQMGSLMGTLENMGDSLTPAERQEVDRCVPVLRQMASDTTKAIDFIKNVEGETWRPVYRKDVADLAAAATSLSNSLGEFVTVVKLREKENHIETQLGVSGF